MPKLYHFADITLRGTINILCKCELFLFFFVHEKNFDLLLQGDSGGPLVVNGKLVGLVSWAKACSLTDYPTVYTRVSSYINWIKESMESEDVYRN